MGCKRQSREETVLSFQHHNDFLTAFCSIMWHSGKVVVLKQRDVSKSVSPNLTVIFKIHIQVWIIVRKSTKLIASLEIGVEEWSALERIFMQMKPSVTITWRLSSSASKLPVSGILLLKVPLFCLFRYYLSWIV